MRVFINEKKVRFRSRVATISSLFGLGVLLAGMIITLTVKPDNPLYPFWVSAALAALLLGFLAAQIGNHNLRRFARRPRMDEVLDRSLKGFDNRYEMYHWLLPAEHVLLGPAGVFVFVLRDTKAPVEAVGAKWKQPFNLFRALGLFGQEGLGDPVAEALAEAERLRQWLEKVLPDVEVDIEPLVFFTNPVPIEKNDPVVPPVLPKELKKYLRRRQKEQGLPEHIRRRLSEVFQKAAEMAKEQEK